jgi:hypothetical protein
LENTEHEKSKSFIIVEIIIDRVSNKLQTGQSIIIPAHAHNTIMAKERFKMITTIIKSGYEEVCA